MNNPDLAILIPARSGSKRIPNKNIVLINYKPLIFYTIETALQLCDSARVFVSTDSLEIAKIARKYGANVPSLRSSNLATDESPDIDWVLESISAWSNVRNSEFCAILRPTSPLRTANSVQSALEILRRNPECDSIRAIRPVREHPGKMWIRNDKFITPYVKGMNPISNAPFHSSPFQTLEPLWIQDASLEIARTNSIIKTSSISGDKILAFEMPYPEGFDINYPEDLIELNRIIEEKKKKNL